MKRYIITLLMVVVAMATYAVNKPAHIYIFGFAASFNDSTVYFTEIQEVDSAYIDTHTKFLYSRENYSYQLRDYLAAQGFPNPTCVTFYALTRKEIDKQYSNIKKKYSSKGDFVIKEVKAPWFHYNAIKEE